MTGTAMPRTSETDAGAYRRFFLDSYGIKPGRIRKLERPLPGYRIELVQYDGRIGAFRNDGSTPVGHCDPHFWREARNSRDELGMRRYMAQTPAVTHAAGCSHCGYRIVRSLEKLATFMGRVAARREAMGQSILTPNNRIDGYVVLVECSVPVSGSIAHRNPLDSEISGTIRADRLQLGGRVIVPRWHHGKDQHAIGAGLIRGRYQVEVETPDIDYWDLINSYMGSRPNQLQNIIEKHRRQYA